MDDNNELFSKVESEVLREKVFHQMVQYATEIQIQMQDNTLMNIKSYKRAQQDLVIFRELPDQPEEQDIIVSFVLEPDRYFLKSKLIQKNKSCHVVLTPLLYKLQRRKNFRLSLPRAWSPRFLCKLQNTDSVNQEFPINDLSSGGFSFIYPLHGKFSIVPDAELEGQVMIRNRLDITAKGIVRHYRETGSAAHPGMRVGIEFKDLNQKDESTIMAILMEVHREVFSKLK